MKGAEEKLQAEKAEQASASIKFDPDAEEAAEEKENESEKSEENPKDTQKDESKSEDDKEKKE